MNVFQQPDPRSAENEAVSRLVELIENSVHHQQPLLLLVSGGSAINIAVRARKQIEVEDLEVELHVALVDERYGSPGHSDSNYKKLLDAGFDQRNVILYPVLSGRSIIEEAESYAEVLENLCDQDRATIIGVFGIGADGHTAGLLPNNPIMDSTRYADCYKGQDFDRISITPRMIQRIDAAVVYAVGMDKHHAIDDMLAEGSEYQVPARLLKNLESSDMYTDYQVRSAE